MATIKLNELTNLSEVGAPQAADVKGGASYIKYSDIQGDVTEQSKSVGGFVGGWGSSMYQY